MKQRHDRHSVADRELLGAHLSMLGACAFWGLMAPLGKDAMTHGLDGLTMVSFRVAGGCLLFWLTSLVLQLAARSGRRTLLEAEGRVPPRDILLFGAASAFGLVCNQCCYTIGLSLTSPVNASIVTTSMPIFAMLLSAIILKEPITGVKASGVAMGCAGAVILILTSAAHASQKVGDLRGDLLCLSAQFSFALYLALFNKLIRRHTVVTINKWMFLWATVMLLPFTARHVVLTLSQPVPARSWWEAAYVVFFGTYVGYILTMIGQRRLRPTQVSVYNYVQPVVAVSVSLLAGISVLKWSQAVAVVLVCGGVWLVTTAHHPFGIVPILLRVRRPSRHTDMRAVADAFWLKKGYEALTFFGVILTHSAEEADHINSSGATSGKPSQWAVLKNHEMIHLRQAQACGNSWLRFYWHYLVYWLQGFRVRQQLKNAGYWLNPFEMEAYEHMYDPNYLADAASSGGTTGWQHYARLSPSERLAVYRRERKQDNRKQPQTS